MQDEEDGEGEGESITVPFRTLVALCGRTLATANALEHGTDVDRTPIDKWLPNGGLPCIVNIEENGKGDEAKRHVTPAQRATLLRSMVTHVAAGYAKERDRAPSCPPQLLPQLYPTHASFDASYVGTHYYVQEY